MSNTESDTIYCAAQLSRRPVFGKRDLNPYNSTLSTRLPARQLRCAGFLARSSRKNRTESQAVRNCPGRSHPRSCTREARCLTPPR
eukprot:1134257-Prorocentrum_minimum.AAC.5